MEMQQTTELNKQTTNKFYIDFVKNDLTKQIESLLKIKSTLSQTNSICVLAFLLELHEANPIITSAYYQEFTSTVDQLKAELYSHIHESLHSYIDTISFASEEATNEDFDEDEFIRKVVCEVFVTFSTKEIENYVQNFLSPKVKRVASYASRYLKNVKEYFLETKIKTAIFGSFSETEKNEFLNFVAENYEIADEFFTGIYFFNQRFYKVIKNYVENENLKVFYEFIPEIDFGKIEFIEKETVVLNDKELSAEDLVNASETKLGFKASGKKAENFEVLENLIKKFASKREIIIKRFLLDEKVIERSKIVEMLVEDYEFLKTHLSLFSLSIEENLRIAEKNEDALKEIFNKIENYSNDEINKIAVAISSKENEEFLQDNLSRILALNSKKIILFVNSFIMAKTLSNGMRKFFISKIGDNPKYFYSLMPYFEKERNLQSLSQFLIDTESLNCFLRIFTLGEIFYFAHYVQKIECAIRITGLCIKDPGFDESVVLFAVPKMESDTLPPIFMRTAILCLIKLPEMKKFYKNLLFRMIKRSIWKDKKLFTGFSKLVETIGIDAVDVIMELPPSELAVLLKENKGVLRLSKLYLENTSQIDELKVRRFKSIVFSIK